MNRNTQGFPQNEFSRSKCGKSGKFAPIFHSPPVSSSSDTSIKPKEIKIKMKMMSPEETCGFVGNKIPTFFTPVGPGFFQRQKCSRQVFASEAAAEMTIKALAVVGRIVVAVRCGLCNLIHLADQSGKPDQP